jgi:tetratricopeptide (TPR) repeat protein
MSLGDRVAAGAALDFGGSELANSMSEAARLTMRGHYDEAFKSLDRGRGKFMRSRVLDLPAARLALIAGRATQALAILRERLPDLYSRVEPVNGHNVIPALDLVAAWKATGTQARSRELLKRVSDFLDGPAAPQLPLFVYQRARAHALAGESDMAIQALERAYAAGFRTAWALDLHPQPFLYIDSIAVDPAFAALRSDPRYQSWLAHIKTDSAHQLEQLKVRDAAKPAG